MQEGKEERKGRRERRKKSNEREEGRKEGKGEAEPGRTKAPRRAGGGCARCAHQPSPRPSRTEAGRAWLPLTGPEQHGPVQPGGLGGHPRPLAQPLRHAPARPTAEPALRAGSAEQRGLRSLRPKPAAGQVTGAAAVGRGGAAGEGPEPGRG